MKPDYDIIMFGLIRTDFKLSSTSVAWAKEWAKTNRVFYIDRPYSIKDVRENWKLPAFKKRMNALFFGKDLYEPNQFGLPDFVQVTPRITLPLNFLPDGVVYNILNRFNNYMVTLAIRRIIRDNKVEKYIYFNSFHPVLCPFVPLSVKPQPLANIYQSLDEISEEPYIARHGVMAEKFAVKYCDIAIGTSTKLCKRLSEESQRKVRLLANAADFHTFENAMNKDLPKPDAFTQFTKPVIIYTGHYSDLRMDHDLVIKLAKVFSDHEMVFVGTFDEADREKYGLNKIQNLHFLGSRPIEQLPACLKYSKLPSSHIKGIRLPKEFIRSKLMSTSQRAFLVFRPILVQTWMRLKR